MDLLVTTFEAWPQVKQSLRVYRNSLADAGNWVGFRFPRRAGGPSPLGARVALHCRGLTVIQHLTTGNGFRSGSANTVHFGLAAKDHVDRVEIRWPDGRELTLREPALNRYHDIQSGPPEGSAPP